MELEEIFEICNSFINNKFSNKEINTIEVKFPSITIISKNILYEIVETNKDYLLLSNSDIKEVKDFIDNLLNDYSITDLFKYRVIVTNEYEIQFQFSQINNIRFF